MSATNVLLVLKEQAPAQLAELVAERSKIVESLRVCQEKITELELHILVKDLNVNPDVPHDLST